jgi:hypothetical protein
MVTGGHRSRTARTLLASVASLAIWLTGCAARAPVSPDPPAIPAATIPTTAIPAAAAAAESAVDRAPVETRPAPDSKTPIAVTVAILYSGSVPTQAAIAVRIGEGLAGPGYTVRRIDIDGPETVTPVDAAFEAGVKIVAAVGPGALEVAPARFENAEIVFSQVLEPGHVTRRIRGVAPMPPPALQLAAWAEVDPGLKRIGLITSERFADLVPGATAAAAAIGAELAHSLSTSDRETLYTFRRLAPAIDGLWLAPDSEILSMAVIEEILTHAAELDIGVLVFSGSLLDRGGLISVVAPEEAVARAVVDTIETIRAGRAADLPAEIPLEEAAVRVNTRVAAELGLSERRTEWAIRGRQ